MELGVINHLKTLKGYLFGDLENFEKIYLFNENTFQQSGGELYITQSIDEKSIDFIPEKFESVSLNINRNYNSTIPHVAAIFGASDFIGFLLGDKNKPSDSTKGNLTDFYKGVEWKPGLFCDDKVIELIVEFRHKFVHEFMPYHGVGAMAQYPEQLFFKENDIIILNAGYLTNVFKNRVIELLKDNTKHDHMQSQFEKIKFDDINNKINSIWDAINS